MTMSIDATGNIPIRPVQNWLTPLVRLSSIANDVPARKRSAAIIANLRMCS
jgi:hypothetical protein